MHRSHFGEFSSPMLVSCPEDSQLILKCNIGSVFFCSDSQCEISEMECIFTLDGVHFYAFDAVVQPEAQLFDM